MGSGYKKEKISHMPPRVSSATWENYFCAARLVMRYGKRHFHARTELAGKLWIWQRQSCECKSTGRYLCVGERSIKFASMPTLRPGVPRVYSWRELSLEL